MTKTRTLENRLDALMHEIRDIKKQLILDKLTKLAVAKDKLGAWEMLGKRVSARWDHVSAVDEIIQQREKAW